MKITIDRSENGVHTTIEREPMPPERFRAVVKLAGFAIGGAVLLGAIALVGFWAIPWAVGALVATGLYKLMKAGF